MSRGALGGTQTFSKTTCWHLTRDNTGKRKASNNSGMSVASLEPWRSYKTEIFPDFLLWSFLLYCTFFPFFPHPFFIWIHLLCHSCSDHATLSNRSRNGYHELNFWQLLAPLTLTKIFSFGCLLSLYFSLGKCVACGLAVDIKVIDVGVFVALQAEENTSGRFSLRFSDCICRQGRIG